MRISKFSLAALLMGVLLYPFSVSAETYQLDQGEWGAAVLQDGDVGTFAGSHSASEGEFYTSFNFELAENSQVVFGFESFSESYFSNVKNTNVQTYGTDLLGIEVVLESDPGDVQSLGSLNDDGFIELLVLGVPQVLNLPRGLYAIDIEGMITGAVGAEYRGSLNVSAVPLPAAAWLFGSALLGLLAFSRRRNQRQHYA